MMEMMTGRWQRAWLTIILIFTVCFILYTTRGQRPEYEIKRSAANTLAQLSEKSYQSFVQKRERMVNNSPENISPWQKETSKPSFWDYFVPLFTCPFTIDRMGRLGDGGKFVCGLEVISALERPCVVYSFGIKKQSDFEAELLEKTPCSIFGYDASVDKMGPEIAANDPRVHFNKVFIGAEDINGFQTLGKMMEKNGHDWIDILKMDIEGGEFGVLNQIMDQFEILPFGQLQIEIHGDRGGQKFPATYRLWKRMEEKGLRPFKNELNPWVLINAGGQANPFLMEYAFLNTKGDKALVSLE